MVSGETSLLPARNKVEPAMGSLAVVVLDVGEGHQNADRVARFRVGRPLAAKAS